MAGNRSMPTPPQEEAKPTGGMEMENKAEATQEQPQAKGSSKGPIEVVALRKGFYAQVRRNQGDKFKVEKFEDLGSWMKCTDPKMEQKRKPKAKRAGAGR